ncbi:antibiotic biosynthesis monooxygenase family protein [Caenispirillum salinarum]|uniref:antibiotic biosynthesis monooxygenase family protein n=1 Tax=Caenispirillum salinarum TaxID=859058 RepID=UPI00384F0AE5
MDACTPGCYAVIFTSRRAEAPDDGYDAMAERMVELARAQPGFLGVESARGPDGFGITVSYWESEEAIRAWKHHAEHVAARAAGRDGWYSAYTTRVAQVERAYAMGDPARTPDKAKEDA